ncbi:MAG: bifunctional pyr operon transcriptional regulator/uracil phosphoribosyltransferase PyrR [Candidatus Omnitrophica bacterium]|nr:bifunctional pyr operon transcriptional regulator/uracil phosphoribosyltransferase PyrR [Candidatus Omnitrophota bacterium]MBU4488398.1 bifunctional pyr operon transcriptional regulator/uracil phosphoribosyltransferase PyrR [Candidatus Omnitrophota bacterium]MCG2704994.1 bifunctional pyr operon transcriptional regulator/uracil phosphoribosyltransferase PyrR [Candidatus Omnitrophota bacterium]
MSLKEKAKIMDKEAVDKALTRIAHEVLEKNKDTEALAIIGIKNRGAYIGSRLRDKIEAISGKRPPVGALDITLYRDDLTQIAEQPVVHATEIDFNIDGKKVILADDVLYTGRTIRCALDALIDFGRPNQIQLAVLIDRGHRELPIRADYVGKNVPTSLKEVIEVKLSEVDGKDEVIICEKVEGK